MRAGISHKEDLIMNTVDVIFIVDNSGSMSGLEKDTLGGFNSVLQQQKQLDANLLRPSYLTVNITTCTNENH